MAKMRGIKPETFTDDKVLQLSPLARWLFVGMWTLACDNGHVEDNAVQLKVRLLPVDDCTVGNLVEELLATGQVRRGDGWLKVVNLPEHQNIDRRYLRLCEWCAHDQDATFTEADRPPRPSRAHRADGATATPAHRGHTVPTPGAQRGHIAEGEGEGEGEELHPPALRAVEATEAVDRFEEWWEAYDKKSGKKAARQKWTNALKKKGVTPDILIQATNTYINSQRAQNKHPEYTKNPATWLNGEHWNDEPTGQGQAKVAGWWNR